jgi:hypothetical protein
MRFTRGDVRDHNDGQLDKANRYLIWLTNVSANSSTV